MEQLAEAEIFVSSGGYKAENASAVFQISQHANACMCNWLILINSKRLTLQYAQFPGKKIAYFHLSFSTQSIISMVVVKSEGSSLQVINNTN